MSADYVKDFENVETRSAVVYLHLLSCIFNFENVVHMSHSIMIDKRKRRNHTRLKSVQPMHRVHTSSYFINHNIIELWIKRSNKS